MWGATCVLVALACAHEAYARPFVPEVRGVIECESNVSGIHPEDFEEFDCLAMGEDVK